MSMQENTEKSRKKFIILIIIIAVAVIAAAATLLIWQVILKNDEEMTDGVSAGEVVPWDIEIDVDEDTAGAWGSIQIPGYESMTFAAGETVQTVDIGNPASNSCYFVITIRLEDGTQLFQSGYLEPGQGYTSIELTQSLEAGEYIAVIQYECYSLEDKSALNGASSEFRLFVI